jgi:hypothetical protein
MAFIMANRSSLAVYAEEVFRPELEPHVFGD